MATKEEKKAEKKRRWDKETKILTEFMYENGLEEIMNQLSPYHWRAITGKRIIDIWPGCRKFWFKGMNGSAFYNNINKLKEYI